MNCPGDEEVFYNRVFRLLENGELRSLEAHLGSCGRCRDREQDLRRRLGCFESLGEIAPREGLAERVLARIEAAARWRRRLYVAALLVLAAAAGTLVWLVWRLAENKSEHRFLRELEHAIQVYRNDHGSYPPPEAPLGRLLDLPPDRVDGEGRVLDRWGRPVRYVVPGEHNPELFDLQSDGSNGRDETGKGDDLVNW